MTTWLNRLVDVLADLYSRPEESRRIVAFAGMNAALIAFDGSAKQNWFSILQVAERSRGKTQAILDLALKEYPDHDDLLALKQEISTSQPRIASSRLPSAPRLIGRESELEMLDAAWSDAKTHVVTIVAFGGVGKSTLAAHWAPTKYDEAGYFDWSFYRQGSSDVFLKTALEFFGDAELAASAADGWTKGERLAHLVAQHRTPIKPSILEL